jgi:hypothetical protein
MYGQAWSRTAGAAVLDIRKWLSCNINSALPVRGCHTPALAHSTLSAAASHSRSPGSVTPEGEIVQRAAAGGAKATAYAGKDSGAGEMSTETAERPNNDR